MASPFATFRRHQRVLLAVTGILAMVAFVFLGPALDYLGGFGSAAGRPENPVVVSWRFGDIHRSQFENIRRVRYQVNAFLREAYTQAVNNGATPRPPLEIPVEENAIVTQLLFANKARELGMTIGNDAINEYLKEITANSVTSENLQAILRAIGQGGARIGMEQVFDTLKTDLLAMQLASSFSMMLGCEPPAQRFEYYSKLERRATIEAAGVSIADFMAQAPNPSDAELARFYEIHKDTILQPVVIDNVRFDTPQFGFKQPPRATFQYVQADYLALLNAEKANITDAAVKEYYETHKESFRRISLDSGVSGSGAAPAEDESQTPVEPSTDESTPGEPSADSNEPNAKESPAAAVPEVEGPTAPGESGTTEPTVDKPAESPVDDDASETSAEDSPTPEPTPQSSLRTNRFRSIAASHGGASALRWLSASVPWLGHGPLVWLQDPEPAEPAPSDAENADPAPAETEPTQPDTARPDTVQPDQPLAEVIEEGEPQPTELEVVEAAPGSPGEVPSETPPVDEPAGEPQAADALPDLDNLFDSEASTPAATPTPTGPYETLEEVADQIRGILAGPKVEERIATEFGNVQARIRSYQGDLAVWESQAKPGETPAESKPTPPDIRAQITSAGFTFGETRSLSAYEFFEQEGVGKSFRQIPGVTPQPFVNFAFSGVMEPFTPVETYDLGHRYLTWKVAEREAYVPTLDEIRSEVETAWKTEKARDLAKKRAEALAAQAANPEQPLKEVFSGEPGLTFVEAGPFSWLTYGSTARDPTMTPPVRMDQIASIPNAGPEFMRAVFALEPGKTGVAANHPQTMFYVVRLKALTPTESALRGFFMAESYRRYITAGSSDRNAMAQAWIKQLEEQAKLEKHFDTGLETAQR